MRPPIDDSPLRVLSILCDAIKKTIVRPYKKTAIGKQTDALPFSANARIDDCQNNGFLREEWSQRGEKVTAAPGIKPWRIAYKVNHRHCGRHGCQNTVDLPQIRPLGSKVSECKEHAETRCADPAGSLREFWA